MTREEFLNLKTAPEMWKALVQNPDLRTKEFRAVFEQCKRKEFEERITKRYGSYDPNMYYEIQERKK